MLAFFCRSMYLPHVWLSGTNGFWLVIARVKACRPPGLFRSGFSGEATAPQALGGDGEAQRCKTI